jgi:hypothetical protein
MHLGWNIGNKRVMQQSRNIETIIRRPYTTLRCFQSPRNCNYGRSNPKSITQKKMEMPIIGKLGEPENPGDAVPIA